MSATNFEMYHQIMNKIKDKVKIKGNKELVYELNMADSLVWRIQREVNSMKKQHAKELEKLRLEVIRLMNSILFTHELMCSILQYIGHENIM